MQNKTRREKIYIGISYFIRISIIIAIILSIYTQNWINFFVSFITLFLIYLPIFFAEKFEVHLPLEFQTIIILFIYAGIFLGEVREFYINFWWWDSILHAFSGLALGFAGFLILYIFYKSGKFDANPFWIAVFSFCFALALGALWEIFEFFVDSFFETNMQRARFSIEIIEKYGSSRISLYDTMWDLILDASGALIASISGYFYLVKGDAPIISRLIKIFEEKNPRLFLKRKKSNTLL